jgi:predicted MFS family arabinose efflux permease
MKAFESKSVLSLGAIMAFRMLGLFMILPVFSAYVHKVPGATPTLIGVALGIYGLTQACLQIPFGTWSDKIGRKPVILIGLLLFGFGSVVAALSHSITGIIIGRALQGGGAVGSTVLALVADLTRDEHRSKAMAFVGLTIGMAFSVAMILGPLVNAHYQLAGIFWLTAAFALIGIILLFTVVPHAPKVFVDDTVEPVRNRFKAVLHNTHLVQLDISILVQHAILTAIFIAIPILLTHDMHLSSTDQTWMYLIVLGLAFIAMVPFIIIAEKKRKMKSIFTGCIAALLLSQVLFFFFQNSTIMVAITLFIFFTAFTVLEASLPSLVSKVAPIRNKGTAMGVYSSSQFFGIFVGGLFGGIILGHFGLSGLFVFAGVLSLAWLILSFQMPEPPYLSTLIFNAAEHGEFSDARVQSLLKLSGVAEAVFMKGEALIYVKIDKLKTSKDEVAKSLGKG